MWFPHFVLEFWEPESSQESIDASLSDQSERRFEVWFALEDPPARTTNDVSLALERPEHRQQTDAEGREVDIQFVPNKSKRLSSVGFRIFDTNSKAAFHYCIDKLSQLLSFWAFSVGTGFSIAGLRVVDEKNQAMWKVRPQRTAPETFNLPTVIGMGPEYAAIVSLYREGRNSIAPYYRFLCFYKILEGWHRNRSVFGRADQVIKRKKLPFTRPRRRVTKEMLVYALLFDSRPDFLNKTFGQLFDLLNPYRVQVAHAITDTGTFVDFDLYKSSLEIAPIANLTDLIVRQILNDELALWRKIRESKEVEPLDLLKGTDLLDESDPMNESDLW